MTFDDKLITVLGNNSGRNEGDNAILGNLLYDITNAGFNGIFQIPTINTKFVQTNFEHYRIKPVGMMPWNLAIRNFGWPLYKAMTKTNMVLITDNILFDKQLYNPLFNNLKSISFFSSFCKKKEIPIILYNASIGPIDKLQGKKALQKVLDACTLIIARDKKTEQLIDKLGIQHPEIIVHADCALNTNPPSDTSIKEIIRKENLFQNPKGTIGLNVNAYVGSWNNKNSIGKSEFCKIIANTANQLIDHLGVDILFTITQAMDSSITRNCIKGIRSKDKVRIIENIKYNYQEITAILSHVDVHAGLRTHSLIFCAISGTPMISINAYPKSVAFLETIGMDKWSISIPTLTDDSLFKIIIKAWNERYQLRKKILHCVESEKEKAAASAQLIINRIKQANN